MYQQRKTLSWDPETLNSMAEDMVRASQFAESLCRPIPSQNPSCQEKIALVTFEGRFLDLVNVESLIPIHPKEK